MNLCILKIPAFKGSIKTKKIGYLDDKSVQRNEQEEQVDQSSFNVENQLVKMDLSLCIVI